MRHANGKYLLCKRSLYPFQLDTEKNISIYLNHFVILKEYEESDNLPFRVGHGYTLDSLHEREQMVKISSECFKNDPNGPSFSPKEWMILKYISQNNPKSHKDIAQMLGISLTTLQKTDNTRILQKARNYFQLENFENIRDVAIYLERMGVMG